MILFGFRDPYRRPASRAGKNRVFGSMVLACVRNSGSRHTPSKSNLTTTSPNSVSNLFESKHLYFASENGTTPPYARVYCAVWSISKPTRTLSHGLGLNAYQIVNKLRSSVASCMFQTWKHITPWYDQSLYMYRYPYPNTCQNHASENTIYPRPRGWTAVGVSETEKNQTRKTVLTHLQHISSSTRTDE